jgi:hypothetical protein
LDEARSMWDKILSTISFRRLWVLAGFCRYRIEELSSVLDGARKVGEGGRGKGIGINQDEEVGCLLTVFGGTDAM